jgi:ubiquinone biosynthesis protein UbiJ
MSTESASDRALNALLDDVEEALSRGVGDVAAHRLMGAARQAAALGTDAGSRLLEGLVEYALEEKRLLVRRAELDDLAAAGRKLEERLGDLERRLDRMGGGR